MVRELKLSASIGCAEMVSHKYNPERFQTLIESIDDWLWEIDSEGVYTYSSPQVFQILGYTPDEVIGKRPLDFMTPQCASLVRHEFYEVLKSQTLFRLVETDHLHKDGRLVNIETSGKPIFDQHGRFVGMRGLDRDITQKIEDKSKIDTLLAVMEQMAEAAIFVDVDLIITYVNQTFLNIFDYEKMDLLGKPLSIMNPGKSKDVKTETVVEALKENGLWSGTVLRRKQDGENIPVYLNATAIYKDSQVIGYAGTYSDLRELQDTQKRLKTSFVSTISSIALTIESRDPYTAGHQSNVSKLSQKLARLLGETEDLVEGVGLGAMIHDLGKIHIPAELLNFPGKFSEIEFELIKTHVQKGYDIIKDVDFPWPVKEMVLQHHERMDGSGYPNGIKGDRIIREARILMVCDVVDAVTSHRPYRPAKPLSEALEIISDGKGKLFDPDCVDGMIELVENN